MKAVEMDVEMESPVKKGPETVHDEETQIFSEQDVNTSTSQCINFNSHNFNVTDITKLSAPPLTTLNSNSTKESENEESSPLDLSKRSATTTTTDASSSSISYGLSSLSVNEDGGQIVHNNLEEDVLMEDQILPISSSATDEVVENEECILPDFTESQQWQMKLWSTTANNSQKNLIQDEARDVDESVSVRVIDGSGAGFSKNFIEVGPISDIVGDVDVVYDHEVCFYLSVKNKIENNVWMCFL
jgi:hypothetical protein